MTPLQFVSSEEAAMQAPAPVISFVVIGRNQLPSIGRCLESIFGAVGANNLSAFEVIYVDSRSTDGTVEWIGETYQKSVRVWVLTGETNAGIARNVGAALALGKILFFVDGDMELDRDFLPEVLDSAQRLVHPIVTGQLPERLYDQQGRLLCIAPDRYRISKREYSAELGGIFLIESPLFAKIGGFTAELRVGEDLDLGLRLAARGVKVLRIPKPIAIHHTIEYFDFARLAKMALNGSLLFPGVLFRRHIANRHYLPILLSHQRPTIVLVVSTVLAVSLHPAWIGIYLAYIAAKNVRRRGVSFIQDLVGTFLRSAGFLIGVLCFFPRHIAAADIHFDPAPHGRSECGAEQETTAVS